MFMLKEVPGCLGMRIIRSCSKTDRGVVHVFGDGQGDGLLSVTDVLFCDGPMVKHMGMRHVKYWASQS